MHITVAEKQDPTGRIKIKDKLVIGDREYSYGTVVTIYGFLEGSSPKETSRITTDPALREMLLEREIVASTGDYPPMHPWCRFYRGKGFDAFWQELREAEVELEKREPLNNPDKNPFTSWLHGQVWGIDPAGDALGETEGHHPEIGINSDAGTGRVWLFMGDDPETPYTIEMTPDQAMKVGTHLHALASSLFKADHREKSSAFETEIETIYLTASSKEDAVLLWCEDWDGEGSAVLMTPSQADELSWQLREQAITPRVNLDYGGSSEEGEEDYDVEDT